MAALVFAVPTPLLHTFTPAHLSTLYTAALRRTRSPFDLLNPSATLDAVVHHVVHNTTVSRSALVTACVYIDRLTQAAPHMFVTTTNVQRLFAVAFMLAAKWHEDAYFSSAYFAALFGMSLPELTTLESTFIHTIDYHLFVTTEQFHDAQVALMARALDSPQGLTVYHALVHHRVADSHNAFDLANTWRQVPLHSAVSVAQPPAHHVWAMAANLVRHRQHPLPQPPHRARPTQPQSTVPTSTALCEGRRVVAALARAQLQHDFPQVCEQLYVSELQRRFTDDGIFRYAKLQLIGQSEELDDLVLPPLERLPEPPLVELPSPARPPPPPPPPCDRRGNALEERGHGVRGFGAFLVNAASCLTVSESTQLECEPFVGWASWPDLAVTCYAARGSDVESPCATRGFSDCVEPLLSVPTNIWSTPKFVDFCPIRSW
ncbi:Cyclin-U4-1 [Gracilariopsis chorda]|uniref:Cyclin-U4-1 n=1 Tax=Gracilariopsis chorda TaxID=448386 RepID=A0A2V3J445_9FLOR|nr:Cyclin-U4-1 [Gracilariopsis chorda]|eukprot:PXF49154.1 Cyclin-U4-1 [Gracilariopsis chorda]